MDRFDLREKLCDIIKNCQSYGDDDDFPCDNCGLNDAFSLKLCLPCADDTTFGKGLFVIPVKPCVEQLEKLGKLKKLPAKTRNKA